MGPQDIFLTSCATEVLSLQTFCGLVSKSLGAAAQLLICVSTSTDVPLVRQATVTADSQTAAEPFYSKAGIQVERAAFSASLT